MKIGALFGFIRQRLCRLGLIVGPIFVLIGIGEAVYTGYFITRSVKTDGVVLSLYAIRDKDSGSITYTPVFQFVARDQRSYTVSSSNISTNPPEFHVDEHVQVIYLAKNPIDARISSYGQLWGASVVWACVGFVAWGGGILLLRYERRHNPTYSPFRIGGL
jgi:hypothetical protein